MSIEVRQFATGTKTMTTTLRPDENPSVTVKYNRMEVVDEMPFIKDGVDYDIFDGQYRRKVRVIQSKRPDAKFYWAGDYTRIRSVSPRDGELFTAWKSINLSHFYHIATSRVRRDTEITETMSSIINDARTIEK